MIRSMTGYGRAGFEVGGIPFEVEVRTLNHRFLDLQLRLPSTLANREAEFRSLVQECLRRGKVEVSVRTGASASQAQDLEFDLLAADQYLQAARALQRRHGLSGSVDVGTLLELPGVARWAERSLSGEELYAALRAAFETALGTAVAMREAEGRALARDLEQRLDHVCQIAAALEERSELVERAVRERLRKRAEQLRDETGFLDEARLHQEIVLAADRMDINEELARLRSHAEQFSRALDESSPADPAGRRLGFLLQEMNREANTVGSKAADAPIALHVVELKTELERLREQVQNVE